MAMKNIFTIKGTNAELAAGNILKIEELESARQQGALPHTSIVMSNRSELCELFIFLDDLSDQDKPDYIIFPKQTMTLHVDEGETFQTVFVKNVHASAALALNELKYRISTVRGI